MPRVRKASVVIHSVHDLDAAFAFDTEAPGLKERFRSGKRFAARDVTVALATASSYIDRWAGGPPAHRASARGAIR